MNLALLKKPKFFIPIILVVLIGGVVIRKKLQPDMTYEFVSVAKGNIVQEVSVTGKVKAAEEVDLAFERSGKLNSVTVDVGDRVTIGQILASQDGAESGAQVAQASARLESARATLLQYTAALNVQLSKLEELKKGTRIEEISIQETKVLNAQKSLTDAQITLDTTKSENTTKLNNLYIGVVDVLTDAYAKSNEAVRNKTINMFSTQGERFVLSYTACDTQAGSDAEWLRFTSDEELKAWSNEINSVTNTSDVATLDVALTKSKAHISVFNQFLNRVNDTLVQGCSLSGTTLDTYRSNLSLAQTSVSNALTSVSTRIQDISAQKSSNQKTIAAAEKNLNDANYALAVAQKELELKKAGSTQEVISAQESAVTQARANLSSQEAIIKQEQANIQSYQAQFGKTIIRAPFAGIVTKQDGKIGSIVPANTTIISLISEAKFEIEANVPEADIAKLNVEDIAQVTLDAYGDDVLFDALIVQVDPAETIVDGVSTYRIVLQFKNEDERIKSGMTANIDITTERRENVLSLPQRAIVTKNGEKYARIIKNETSRKPEITEVVIKTGVRGSNGNIEIIEGLSENDKVLIFAEDKK